MKESIEKMKERRQHKPAPTTKPDDDSGEGLI